MPIQRAQQKTNFFYDDVMQGFSFILYSLLLSLSLGLMDHSSIRALNPKVKSAHTLTSGLGPLILSRTRPHRPVRNSRRQPILSFIVISYREYTNALLSTSGK